MSMTHLQISMKFLLQMTSDVSSKNILKPLEPNAFQLRNKQQKCNLDFLLFSCFVKVGASGGETTPRLNVVD